MNLIFSIVVLLWLIILSIRSLASVQANHKVFTKIAETIKIIKERNNLK